MRARDKGKLKQRYSVSEPGRRMGGVGLGKCGLAVHVQFFFIGGLFRNCNFLYI